MSIPENKDLASFTSKSNLTANHLDSSIDHVVNTKMDRRGFFRKMAMLSAAVVIPAGCNSGGSSSTDISTDTTDAPVNTDTELSRAAFTNNLNSVISVSDDSIGVVDLELSLVDQAPSIPEADQFILSLTGPTSPVLEEKTYAAYNENIGDFELFIQQGSADSGQQTYMAVFSILHS